MKGKLGLTLLALACGLFAFALGLVVGFAGERFLSPENIVTGALVAAVLYLMLALLPLRRPGEFTSRHAFITFTPMVLMGLAGMSVLALAVATPQGRALLTEFLAALRVTIGGVWR